MSASQINLNLQAAFPLLSLPDVAAEKACHLVYRFNLPGDAYQGVLRAVSWAGDTEVAKVAYHIRVSVQKARTFT